MLNASTSTAAVAAPAPPRIRIMFRDARQSDAAYIVDSWKQSWRHTGRNRRLRGDDYARKFNALVRDGILAQPDTQYLIGCAPDRSDEIWCWLCFTPGLVPTVHYAVTKAHAQPSLDRSPRGLGFLTRLLGAAGIRSSLVYTFKPAERSPYSNAPLHAEERMLQAAKRAGIAANYHSVEEFLAHRGTR